MKKFRRFLLRFPVIFYALRYVYRHGRYLYNGLCVSLVKNKTSYWNRYLLLDPVKITKKSLLHSNKFLDCGKVRSGDWDKSNTDFKTEYPYYASIKKITEGNPWDKTPLYMAGMEKLNCGETAFGCRSITELQQRGDVIKQLIEDIKLHSYRMPEKETFANNSDEVSVHISRHGEFLLGDGGHRLSIAQLLGLKQIPVQVCYRHADWNELRQMLIFEAHMQGKLYQRVAHPDLDFLPYAHDTEDRFKIILPNIRQCSGRKLLDIGTNWAMMCHHFEAAGFDCIAAENDPTHIKFARKIRNVFDKKFELYEGSVFDMPLKKYGRFSVVLALNIFHHFLKTDLNFHRMEKFLTQLDTEAIVFQPHMESERQIFGLYRNFSETEFCEFIMKTARLKNCKKIGEENNRNIYLISGWD
ncbi:MAG: hypothetical protein WCS77_01340 [Elusimicrobiaceae bacterium]